MEQYLRVRSNPSEGRTVEREARSSIVRPPAPVKSRQQAHLYSNLLQNCRVFIPLSCRDFTGAGDRTVGDQAEKEAKFHGLGAAPDFQPQYCSSNP